MPTTQTNITEAEAASPLANPSSSPASPAIAVSHATLQFPLRRNKAVFRTTTQSIGGAIIETPKGQFVRALDDITLEIPHGQRVALIGRNGAGKSTLLRLMAGIYQPSMGACAVDGKISSLFSTSLGLNRNGTGYENMVQAARLIGLQDQSLPAYIKDIEEFSELGAFLQAPISTYSQGMQARLSFAAVTSIKPDILLIDEVFGVGDASFQEKAKTRIKNVMSQAATMVLASHATKILTDFCTHAIWLERGKVRMYDDINTVLNEYSKAPGEKA